MEKTALWGIALILALAISYGSAEVSFSETTEKEVFEKVANESLPEQTDGTVAQPPTTEDAEGTEGVSQVAERRMSLYDFFFGNKNNNNNNDRNSEQQSPTILPGQQPVQQNPNQLMFVRETNFPNPNGGLLSRLILARRMSRLQRLSNRLQILPAMFGMFQRQQAVQQRTLNQRIGGQWQPEYNPADILLDGVGFKNASISNQRQYSQAGLNQNQNFANDMSFSQNQGQGRFTNANFYGINEVPNQPYPQTQTSLEEFERLKGNFGLRQNAAAFDQHQQARNKENIYNAQQPSVGHQQQITQQAAYEQQIRNQDQQPQLNQQQQHYEQEQQQLKYQQQLLEHQEQLRKQQQQLYEQHQQHLRQQQLYDQQQQQLKDQLEQYEKQQQQMQQKQAKPQDYEQKANQQPYDQEQLRLQQDLYEQQNQLKQLLLDQQQKLKLQDERFQQLEKQVVQDQKQPTQQKTNQQARDSSYYGGAGNAAFSGNSGVQDFGGPAAYDVGVENPFKGQVGGHTYNQAGTVDGNIGVIDKTAEEKPIAIGFKPVTSISSGWKLPLFPLGIFPRPLLNLNGKVFFGAELGKGGGVKGGGWK